MAATANEWFLNRSTSGNTSGFVYANTDKSYINITMTSYIKGGCNIEPYVHTFAVNGVDVRMDLRCMDRETLMAHPLSNRGYHYMVNEFKTKNSVNVGGVIFSAKGYNNIKRLVENAKAL